MIVLSIEQPLGEMMERFRELEWLMAERFLEVQSRSDFRAVVQMRAQLEEMSHEMVMTSFANGTRRRALAEQTADPMEGRHFRQHRPI